MPVLEVEEQGTQRSIKYPVSTKSGKPGLDVRAVDIEYLHLSLQHARVYTPNGESVNNGEF